MHRVQGVYVLSLYNVSRKVKIFPRRMITGECPFSGVWRCCQTNPESWFQLLPLPKFDTIALSCSLHHVLFAAPFFFTLLKIFRKRRKEDIKRQRPNWVGKVFQLSTGRKFELLWNLNESCSSLVIFMYLFPCLAVLLAFPTLPSKQPQKGQLWNRNYLWAEEQKQSFQAADTLVLAKPGFNCCICQCCCSLLNVFNTGGRRWGK